MGKLSLSSLGPYHELPEWRARGKILQRARARVELQKSVAAGLYERDFRPDETGGAPVGEAALRELLEADRDVRGIATERHITNAIPFNVRIEDTVRSREVRALRREIDREVSELVGETFEGRWMVANSGQFWYPPGGYMGWHTNSGYPGWRMYLTVSEEPGRSFFRYRDPGSGEIVTSKDSELDFRLFRVSSETLLWHAVYSETNRFSIGYIIQPWTLRRFLSRQAESLLGRG